MTVKQRILVADDSPTVTGILSYLFSEEGFHVEAAADGVEAIKKFYDLLPDLLILDIEMPRMTGYQVCRIIKDDPVVSRVPIVILTSRDMQSVRYRAISAGADAHLIKNLEDDELLQTVRRLIENSPWSAQARPEAKFLQEDDILQRTNSLLDHRLFLAQVVSLLQDMHLQYHEFNKVVEKLLELFTNVFEFHIGGLLIGDGPNAELYVIKEGNASAELVDEFTGYMVEASGKNSKDKVNRNPKITLLPFKPKFVRTASPSETLSSKLSWPLLARGEVIGYLGMAAKALIKFDPNGLEVMSTFIKHFAIILDNAQLTQKLIDANRELRRTLGELQSTQTQLIQSEKLASLGQLMAGLVHEMNNPLNFIHGNMTYIRNYTDGLIKLVDACLREFNESLPESVKTVSEEIDILFIRNDFKSMIADCEEGLQRAREIINDLRTFSSHDRGDMVTADLAQVMESTLNILKHRLPAGIAIVKRYKSPVELTCNAGQLGQVMMNLITNALEAIRDKPGGEGRIEILIAERNGEMVLQVKDNGVGIPEENLPKLYQPFFTTREVGRGMGMGLAITHGIVQRHCGRIEVDSKVGHGTSFSVLLPLNPESIDIRREED